MLEFLQNLFPTEVYVFVVSMLPVVELRGSIPLGVTLGMPVIDAMLLSLIGNFFIVIILLYLLPIIVKYAKHIHPSFDRYISKVLAKTQHKHSKKFYTYGAIILITFVAIPFPGTGGWTGSLVAYVFGIPKRLALIYIFIGLVIAMGIVGGLSAGVLKLA